MREKEESGRKDKMGGRGEGGREVKETKVNLYTSI